MNGYVYLRIDDKAFFDFDNLNRRIYEYLRRLLRVYHIFWLFGIDLIISLILTVFDVYPA